MDLHVEFRLASRYQATELYKRFYVPDSPEEVAEGGDEGVGEGDGNGNASSDDSGYVTPTKEEGSDGAPSVVSKAAVGHKEPPPKYNGTAHSARAPKLSRKKIEQLAEQFSARIPERELSMASLQGYLMSYKIRPLQAVDDVERWVEDTQEAQDRLADARAATTRGR